MAEKWHRNRNQVGPDILIPFREVCVLLLVLIPFRDVCVLLLVVSCCWWLLVLMNSPHRSVHRLRIEEEIQHVVLLVATVASRAVFLPFSCISSLLAFYPR